MAGVTHRTRPTLRDPRAPCWLHVAQRREHAQAAVGVDEETRWRVAHPNVSCSLECLGSGCNRSIGRRRSVPRRARATAITLFRPRLSSPSPMPCHSTPHDIFCAMIHARQDTPHWSWPVFYSRDIINAANQPAEYPVHHHRPLNLTAHCHASRIFKSPMFSSQLFSDIQYPWFMGGISHLSTSTARSQPWLRCIKY